MMTLEAVKTDIASIKSTMAANNCQIKSGNDMKSRDHPVQIVKQMEGRIVVIVMYVVQGSILQGDVNEDRETGEDSF